jgi:transposase
MPTAPVWVGIDVAKEQLDVALGAEGGTLSVPNDDAGIRALLAELRQHTCALVVLEATGGFEVPAVSALAAAGLPVVVVNPRQVRNYARAIGQLAKTDRLDARVLASFAERVRPEVRSLPEALHGSFGMISAGSAPLLYQLDSFKLSLYVEDQVPQSSVVAMDVRSGCTSHNCNATATP